MKKPIYLFLFFILSHSVLAQTPEPLGGAINSEFTEGHPIISADGGSLYFIRIGHPSNSFGKESSMDVWYSDFLGGSWTVARRMPNTINKNQYNELFSITPDGNTALIRGVYNAGRIENEKGISVCKKKGMTWQQPNKMDIPKLDAMCKGQYLTAYLSNNGKVLLMGFSEKKNGKSDDLYFSLLDKAGKWSKPESLGDGINTDLSETTPFLASDNISLYFASNRKGGQGGFDIWMSKRRGKGWTSWTKPINIGSQVNSEKDEFDYSIEASAQFAYFTSKNNSIGKTDIFKISLVPPAKASDTDAELATSTTDKKTDDNNKEEEVKPTTVAMVSGIVKDQKTGKSIEAKIVYEDLETGEELGIAVSNATTGEYKVVLPYGKRYAIRAEANDFISVSKNYDLSIPGIYKQIQGEDLLLAPIQTGVIVQLNNIFFEFGRADLQEASFYELDRMVELLEKNKNMLIEVQGHTDNVGSAEANEKLSQSRAESVRAYILSKKISEERVKSRGFGENKPISSNSTTEGQAKNRRVEFEILRK